MCGAALLPATMHAAPKARTQATPREFWQMSLDGGRTLATYSLAFDPGRVLSMLARGPVVDRVRKHLAKRPPEGLKRAAESPGS